MSASSKPPRGTHNAKPPTTERVARALIDAQVLGDKAAARRHGVHANTIKNWRRDWGSSPAVVAEMGRLQEAVRAGWIDEARDARRKALSRAVELLDKARNLRSVAEALRRINEVVVAHEILHDDPGAAADALADDADQQQAAGEAEGEGRGEGDDGEGNLGGGEG